MSHIKTLVVILFLVFSQLLLADGDSIVYTSLSHNKIDSIKIDSLINVAYTSRFQNPNRAIALSDKAITMARDAGLYERMLKAYRTKGVFYIISAKYDSAIFVYEEAIPLAKKYHQVDVLINIYLNLGIVYTKKGDFKLADKYYSMVLNKYYYKLSENKKSIIYNNLGMMFMARGEYLNAVDYHFKALKIRDDLKDSIGKASSMMNIANIYFYQEDYAKAMQFYKKAAMLFKQLNNNYNLGHCFHNIGTIYEKQDSLSLARVYLRKALKIEAPNLKTGRAKTFNMLGLVNLKEKHYLRAEQYFIKALKELEGIQSQTVKIPVMNNFSTLFNRQHKFDLAMKYNREAMALSKQSGAKEYEKDACLNTSNTYEGKGDYFKALHYFKCYVSIRDSLIGSKKYEQIHELQIKYNTAKNERELDLRNAELLKKDLESKEKDAIIKKTQIQIYAILIIVILLLLIFIIVFRNQIHKRKAAQMLLDTNDELRNKEIADLLKKHQLNSIKGRMEAEEAERNRIALELHDGIGGSLAAIKLFVDSLRKNNPLKELDVVHANINNIYNEVRTLSHNLKPPKFQFSSITDIVKDYANQISKNSELHINLYSNPKANWNILPDDIQIGIFRISQELINNVIKHADANKIEIRLEMNKKVVIVSIEDNGKGFDTANNFKGIGLQNIYQRVASMHGKVEINSIVGKGTTVSFEIPIEGLHNN